jgi:1,4-dihydroxy-2-naphthoate octaprenyltransferase
MTSKRELWTRKLLYPGHTLPTAAAPVLVAMGLAVHDGVFATLPAIAAFIAGWLIQFAGVVTDNYENLVREPDDHEHPEMVAAVSTGLITLRGLKATIITCYTLAALAGGYLVFVGGLQVVAIGLLSMLASWAYSAGPAPVGRIGFADPLFFLFFGVVSVAGTYYVQAASHGAAGFPWVAIVLGIPVGALATNILIIDDIRDREFDVVKGKRTIAVRFGAKWSRAEFLVLMTIAYAAPFWFWRVIGLGPWSMLPMVSLPMALLVSREVMRRDKFADLVPMTPRAAMLALAYAVLLALGLTMA